MRTKGCIFFFIILLAVGTHLSAQQRSRISGTVQDRQGNPVAGATIVAENPRNMPSSIEKTSDEDGRFAFGGLQAGSWDITAQADGFLKFQEIIELGMGQNLRMEIILDRATGAALLATSSEKQKEIDQARARFDAGDYDGAIGLYERLLVDAPDVYQIHFNLGLSYERKGDFEKAAEHYRRFVMREPGHFQGNLNLANALSRLGRNDEAIPYYENCTRIEPENAVALYNLGLAFFEIGRLEPSAEAFEKSLTIDPSLADSHFMLGNIHLRNGDEEGARKSYERFLELAPDSPQAEAAREALTRLK